MKKGNKIVEQVNNDGEIILDYDNSLSPSEIFKKLCTFFPNIQHEDGLIVGEYKNQKFSILIKNITYLGNPHPIFKKRIQIANLPSFYEASIAKKYQPLLLGIYSYNDNVVFCDFKIDTYLKKKSHNSSAHVYTEDISRATLDGIFQKEDYFKNTITVVKADYIEAFLEDKFFDIKKEDSLIEATLGSEQQSKRNAEEIQRIEEIFFEFFDKEPKTWKGIDCYKKMISDNYRNKYQPEWAGFFLEYEFEKYLKENDLKIYAEYFQDKTKEGIDLDLFFPQINSFGDLKAHSSNSNAIQGNDWETVYTVLNSETYNNHIYYIVCEHDTYKDSDFDYETTKYWNIAQGKDKVGKLFSYKSRMKNSVKLKKYYILDINKYNFQYLTKFKQGINSNGKLRKPKIMIEHDNFDKFLIAEVTFQE